MGNQAVSHRGESIYFNGLSNFHVLHGHADDKPAHNVYEGYNYADDGIAFYKLTGAVHGAVKIRFPLYLRPAFFSGRLVNDSGIQVRVYGHLLSRHGVKGKAGGNFGYALGALCDDYKLYGNNYYKGHDSNHKVPADNKVAEGADDLARVSSVAQYQLCGRQAQGKPEKGCDQQ